MTTWDAEKIRFLADAAEYLGFYGALAKRMATYLPAGAHVCDAGCGLGYLALALAPVCARVTAVDCSTDALSVLRRNAARGGVRNLTIWEGDAFAMPEDMRFDAMAFCFFGSVAETLRMVRRHCAGPAVLFKKNWTNRRFTAAATLNRKITLADACAELAALHVPYVSETFLLDMGQPFRSLADAAAFFALYREADAPQQDEMGEMRARLRETGSPEFPYYLPAPRSVGMIVVQATDI